MGIKIGDNKLKYILFYYKIKQGDKYEISNTKSYRILG